MTTLALSVLASMGLIFAACSEGNTAGDAANAANRAAEAIDAAGQVGSNVYKSSYAPLVLLRLQRGDELRLTYRNGLDKADLESDHPKSSNIHDHGMGISPEAPADRSVHVNVSPEKPTGSGVKP